MIEPCVSVLVVEDEILIAIDLEAILVDHGFRVIGPCVSLEEALATLQTASPDLAVLDFDLAGVSSLPLASELRRRDIPFVFLTGSSGNETAARDYRDSLILQKPFDIRALIGAIDSLTRQERRA